MSSTTQSMFILFGMVAFLFLFFYLFFAAKSSEKKNVAANGGDVTGYLVRYENKPVYENDYDESGDLNIRLKGYDHFGIYRYNVGYIDYELKYQTETIEEYDFFGNIKESAPVPLPKTVTIRYNPLNPNSAVVITPIDLFDAKLRMQEERARYR